MDAALGMRRSREDEGCVAQGAGKRAAQLVQHGGALPGQFSPRKELAMASLQSGVK
jgi:hypothetical protein